MDTSDREHLRKKLKARLKNRRSGATTPTPDEILFGVEDPTVFRAMSSVLKSKNKKSALKALTSVEETKSDGDEEEEAPPPPQT